MRRTVDTTSQWFGLQHAFARWLVDVRIARMVTEVPDVDRAPLVYVAGGRAVQPDLLVDLAHERCTVWMDSKGKSRAVVYGHSGRLRTGIDWDELHAYRQVESVSGRPAVVAFIHVKECEVRYVAASSAAWQRGHDGGEDMAYVDYESLPVLARWNGNCAAPRFQLATDAFITLPVGVQLGLDGVVEAPSRRVRKGYRTLPQRVPPVGVKGWPGA